MGSEMCIRDSTNTEGKSPNGRARVETDNFDSIPQRDSSSHDSDIQSLKMPVRLNPHENGLRRSPRLIEKREKEEKLKRKAHATFGTVAATKLAFGVFSLFALTSNFTMPKHQTNPDVTHAERIVIRFHEVNELCDGTINTVSYTHLTLPTKA